MNYESFMSKVRHWDNRMARWMMNHFYFIFFQIVLIVIFFIFFFNLLRTIDLSADLRSADIIQQLLLQQTINTSILIFLMIMNSFWMLFIFSGLNRIRFILRDLAFHLLRRKGDRNQD